MIFLRRDTRALTLTFENFYLGDAGAKHVVFAQRYQCVQIRLFFGVITMVRFIHSLCVQNHLHAQKKGADRFRANTDFHTTKGSDSFARSEQFFSVEIHISTKIT